VRALGHDRDGHVAFVDFHCLQLRRQQPDAEVAYEFSRMTCTEHGAGCTLRFCTSNLRKRPQRETVMSSEYPGDEKLLTKGEVARLCRVDVRTVDRWLTAGKIGFHRTPSGRVLFRRHDVLKAVDPAAAALHQG
jgi:excisionase family DNA binding protein